MGRRWPRRGNHLAAASPVGGGHVWEPGSLCGFPCARAAGRAWAGRLRVPAAAMGLVRAGDDLPRVGGHLTPGDADTRRMDGCDPGFAGWDGAVWPDNGASPGVQAVVG